MTPTVPIDPPDEANLFDVYVDDGSSAGDRLRPSRRSSDLRRAPRPRAIRSRRSGKRRGLVAAMLAPVTILVGFVALWPSESPEPSPRAAAEAPPRRATRTIDRVSERVGSGRPVRATTPDPPAATDRPERGNESRRDSRRADRPRSRRTRTTRRRQARPSPAAQNPTPDPQTNPAPVATQAPPPSVTQAPAPPASVPADPAPRRQSRGGADPNFTLSID